MKKHDIINGANEITLPRLRIETPDFVRILKQFGDQHRISVRISDDITLDDPERIRSSQKLLTQNPLVRIGPVTLRFHEGMSRPTLTINPDELQTREEIGNARMLMYCIQQSLIAFRDPTLSVFRDPIIMFGAVIPAMMIIAHDYHFMWVLLYELGFLLIAEFRDSRYFRYVLPARQIRFPGLKTMIRERTDFEKSMQVKTSDPHWHSDMQTL